MTKMQEMIEHCKRIGAWHERQRILKIIDGWWCAMKANGLISWDKIREDAYEELKQKIKEK